MEFLQTFIFPHINFAIFCAIVFFGGRKAIAEIFEAQRKDFELALESGQASLKTAQTDQAAIVERMNGIEHEIKQLRDSSLAVTNSEISRLEEDSARAVEHLRADAQRIARMELQTAQNNLKNSVIEKAVKGIEASLIQSIRGRDNSPQKSLLSKAFGEFEAANFTSSESPWSIPNNHSGSSAKSSPRPVS